MGGTANRRLVRLLARFSDARVLVVGDLMLDHFVWGRVERISPEAPVPVVQVTRESFCLGGAANAVQNIRALGGQATACGVVGRDPAGRMVLRLLREVGASTEGVVVGAMAVTTRKTRIIAHNQQVVRLDRENPDASAAAAPRLVSFLRRGAEKFSTVILSDYGKGVVGSELIGLLAERWEKGALRLVVDPKRANFRNYRGATLVTPNEREAAEASGIDVSDAAALHAAGERLLEQWRAEAVLVTRGEQGMSLFVRGRPPRHFPTRAREVYDVTGAGDTVAAVCALALGAGADLEDAAVLANLAAGIVVGKVGTAVVSAAELRAALQSSSRGSARVPGRPRRSAFETRGAYRS